MRADFNFHSALCVAAIILGVAIFFNGIHVQPHQSTGLLLTSLGILLLV